MTLDELHQGNVGRASRGTVPDGDVSNGRKLSTTKFGYTTGSIKRHLRPWARIQPEKEMARNL